MRMSSWTPDVIRFMEDASSHTPYFDEIAAAVLRHAGSTARVCDAGCGMGQLAFALAPHAGRVDAVDRSPRAIAYVRAQAEARGLRTVRPRRADVASLRPAEPYDLMVFSLSASLEDARAAARCRCRGTLVVINKMHGAPPEAVRAPPARARPRAQPARLARARRPLRRRSARPRVRPALPLARGRGRLLHPLPHARLSRGPRARRPRPPARRDGRRALPVLPARAPSPRPRRPRPGRRARRALPRRAHGARRALRQAGIIGAAGRRRPFAAGR